ncbi:MAG: thioredoxin domain-containing protein [Gemmatimonadaceae bacterium]|nr:thioredoxin domain-containing protein [Gemmatimonadaceae bacterium]
MPNLLANETSPYLLQHADNPVDWHPWSLGALERARREDKPILLSIGYAACHWCHVMAHESFEDEATAAAMNEHFVNIKVDREERPDLDSIYMQAVQAMTGHGGWPMTVFLTPEGEPFYGGTYFPPTDRHGMQSFTTVLKSVARAYAEHREDVNRSAAQLRQIYRPPSASTRADELTVQMLEVAYRSIAQRYDATHGGFDSAPKFPQAMALDFLLRHGARTDSRHAIDIALNSFRRMARGGIYDQIGGGFARYSVDDQWLVPHFEKMLYDNALLLRLGVHLWQATRDEEVKRVTCDTIAWVEREMTSPEGGFYSSLAADSEGHEGKFYVWSEAELDALLGDESALVKSYYGVTPTGNFEGANILFVPSEPAAFAARLGVTGAALAEAIEGAKTVLYEARSHRVWPGRDEKVLAGWNGLMLRAVAEAARVFDHEQFNTLALRNAELLQREMVRGGRVLRSRKDGITRIPGFLEDHAAVALGFIAVYELTFDERWIDRALEISAVITDLFWDEEARVFFDTAHDAEKLITRPRDVADNAVPAGSSLAADLCVRIAELTGDQADRGRAERVLRPLATAMTKHAIAFGHLLGVADMLVRGGVQVAIAGDPAGDDFRKLTRAVADTYVPALILAGGDPASGGQVALLRGRDAAGGATAYVCRGFTCDMPARDPALLAELLRGVTRASVPGAAGT